MIRTLSTYFSLKIAYGINSIMYHLHRMPVFRKVFAGRSYDAPVFKMFVIILAVIKEIFAVLIYKLFYFLAVFGVWNWGWAMEFVEKPIPLTPAFLHIITLWTFIGAITNNQIFEKDNNSYYAVILLRMDAKRYALTNYIYTMVKHVAGLTLFGIIVALIINLPVHIMLLFPFYVVGVKIFTQSVMLIFYDVIKKRQKIVNAIQVCIVIVAAGYSLLFTVSSMIIPGRTVIFIMIAGIMLGIVFMWKLFAYDNYTLVYKRELSDYMHTVTNNKNLNNSIVVESSRAAINDKAVVVSSKKSGFAYMNNLFVKRHRSLLWRVEIIMTVVAALLFAALAVVVCYGFAPVDNDAFNHVIMYEIPRMLVFFMYMLNRGTQYTQALFINCDHSLLTYSFYKESKSILKLFTIRLIDIIKVNIPVAAVIGVGLDVMLYITGGTDDIVNYGVLIVAPVCLSIFFSVHYLVMYYLLQPFDGETELVSPAYKIVKFITYFVSFYLMQIKFESLYFGMGTIIFCVLYCIAACVLVYFFAPKTFRIRRG